jgi:hypothetical protein
VEHVGLVLSGEAVAKMDDGREVTMRAGALGRGASRGLRYRLARAIFSVPALGPGLAGAALGLPGLGSTISLPRA